MSRIKLLTDALASQVAAGEVVERPASVVKELVENALDAGALNIEVSIRRGGISTISVLDDGCGMNRTDALLSMERHATSKIASAEDLAAISTLGFRGEALPSIASVSRFRLSTREVDALSGTEITISGGKLVSVSDCGGAPGTQVEVRSLFFNVPARRKFLRTENTEFSHLERQVRVQAIAHPEVGFTLVRNDRAVFRLAATDDLGERIRALAGGDLASRLVEVDERVCEGIRIRGFVGEPGLGRSNRSQQLIFLNRRPVEAPVLHYGVREGYHTALMKGQHPVTYLFLEMDPGEVDVNVHPAKREVRFRNGNLVRRVVAETLREVLQTRASGPFSATGASAFAAPVVRETGGEFAAAGAAGAAGAEAQTLLLKGQQGAPSISSPYPPPLRTVAHGPVATRAPGGSGGVALEAEQREAFAAGTPPPGERARPEDFRILGVLGKLYVLMEGKAGLVLMDQHAAHERVLFEEMRRRMESEGVPSQRLLLPLTIELDPRDFDLMRSNLEVLGKLGIAAEEFGSNTLKIDSLPTFFKSDDRHGFINRIVEELRSHSSRTSAMRLGEDMVATTVCRHAVKAHDTLRSEELERLLADLLACELPYCCPHGRPTL
ncbi:MAG: DNA mismatch repair endonuclease MutL, partial [Verrucomicrobiales bacterium]